MDLIEWEELDKSFVYSQPSLGEMEDGCNFSHACRCERRPQHGIGNYNIIISFMVTMTLSAGCCMAPVLLPSWPSLHCQGLGYQGRVPASQPGRPPSPLWLQTALPRFAVISVMQWVVGLQHHCLQAGVSLQSQSQTRLIQSLDNAARKNGSDRSCLWMFKIQNFYLMLKSHLHK